MPSIPTIEVRGSIRLGQVLKRAGLVEDGAEARNLIQSGDVSVNGEVETRRGHALEDGELVELRTPQGVFAAKVRVVDEQARPTPPRRALLPLPRPRGLHECTSQ